MKRIPKNESADASFDPSVIYFVVFAVVILYFTVLKTCFGTFRLRTAVSDYKENSKVRNGYLEMFTTRENMLYHISWAKSRGDMEQAKHLLGELKKLDEEIDKVEQSNTKLFGDRNPVKGDKLT